MKAKDLELPVINSWTLIRNYPYEVLDSAFLLQWDTAKQSLPSHSKYVAMLVVRMLECFFQITACPAPPALSRDTFALWDRVFKQLLGAFYSPHFYFGVQGSRRRLAWGLMEMRASLATNLGAHRSWEIHVPMNRTTQLQRLAELFADLELDADRVAIWQSWPCKRKDGSTSFAPLSPVYTSLGPDFTKKLYDLCLIYAGGRQKTDLYPVQALSRFLDETDFPVTVEMLSDSSQTSEFFFQFYEHYLRNTYKEGKGIPVARIVQRWRGPITNFFHEMVFPSGLIAKPSGAFPSPRGISTIGEPTNIRVLAGGEVHDKLLTVIPLQITDDQALELIFIQIKADLNAAKEWAWLEVQQTARLLERRKELAKAGGVRKIIPGQRKIEYPTAWSHPEHLANAAATFEFCGYPCNAGDVRASHPFPSPHEKWALELALPSTGTLIPHCAVLVGEHPQITSSFLENLELYDKNGKVRGVVSTDSGEILRGAKLRRGANLAAQDISLNERSSFTVDQIIQLTQPVRDYLKQQGDDNWRYLLLTSGKAFAYPRRMLKLSSGISSEASVTRICEGVKKLMGLNDEAAAHFASQFSFSALRATAAVAVYLETKSVEKMVEALGQAQYDPGLLARYLPKVIRDFFQERWIRIFQTGIIVEAMKESKLLLRSAPFNSMNEFDEFLRNHALKVPKQSENIGNSVSNDPWAEGDLEVPKEVVFALNEQILTLLLSLAKVAADPKRPMAALATYWAELTNALVPYIQSTANRRDDIRQYLASAQQNASETLVEAIAYA